MNEHRLRQRCAAWVLAVSFVGLMPAPALAVNPATKLVRGVVNTSTGWLEIPSQMAERQDDGTVMMWAVHGFVYGTIMGLTRTLYGLYDVITFPVGPYDAPLMDPDTLIAPKHESPRSSSMHLTAPPPFSRNSETSTGQGITPRTRT